MFPNLLLPLLNMIGFNSRIMGILKPTSECISYNIYQKEFAWIIVVAINFIAAIIMLHSASKIQKEYPTQGNIFRRYGYFIIGYGVGRVFFIFSDIERWNNGTLANGCFTPLHTQFVLLAYISMIIASLFLIIVTERYILNLKHRYLTYFYLILLVSAIILFFLAQFAAKFLNTIRLFNMLFSSVGALLIVFLYIKAIKFSTGKLRTKAIMIFVGIILIFGGTVIDSELIINMIKIPIWTPAIFVGVGFIILVYFLNPTKTYKTKSP
ncbi:MAG: hypothetical protein ACTSU2_09010 [Promethearchaeota archaeon]